MSSRFKKNKTHVRALVITCIYLIPVLISYQNLLAHHPPAAMTSPGPGSYTQTRSAIGFDIMYRKGLSGNRNEWISTFKSTSDLYEQQVAAYVSFSYHYYDQKDTGNAGRYGRPRLGLQANQTIGVMDFSLQSDVAMASGSDQDTFVDENFYENATYIRAATRLDSFYLALQAGGIFPLSRLPRSTGSDPERLPWQPAESRINRETHNLKRSTIWEAYLGWQAHRRVMVYTSYLYRLPFAGTLQEQDDSGLAPGIYREAGSGLIYSLTDDMHLQLGYVYPLYRKRKISNQERFLDIWLKRTPADPRAYRLMDEAYRLQLIYQF